MTKWTDDRVVKLRELAARRLSASKIAALLGGFETCADGGRSAVIGKCYRLGIDLGHSASSGGVTSAAQRRATTAFKAKQRPQKPPKPFSPDAGQSFVSRETKTIPPCQVRKFADLEANHCRWPHGDPRSKTFGFCKASRAAPGIAYCAHHMRIAYVPEQPARVPKTTGVVRSPEPVD